MIPHRRFAPVFAVLLCSLPAIAGPGWTESAAGEAITAFESNYPANTKGWDRLSAVPVMFPRNANGILGADVRFFRIEDDGPDGKREMGTVFVTRNGSGMWGWNQDSISRVVADLAEPPRTVESLERVLRGVMEFPGAPRFDAARIVVEKSRARYRLHRVTGGMGCGFSGAYEEDLVVGAPLGDSQAATMQLTGKPDLSWEEYCELVGEEDPLRVDETVGTREMLEWQRRNRETLNAQVARLGKGDAAARDAAEGELHRAGGGVVAALNEALKGASPDAAARIARLIRWHSPWPPAIGKDAGAWFASTLGDGWSVTSIEEITSPDADLTNSVLWYYRFFLARAQKPMDGMTRVIKAGRDGVCEFWDASEAQIRAVLDDRAILATDGEASRRAVRIAEALAGAGQRAQGFGAVENERLEFAGRTVTYHEHRMLLLSGRLGTYAEARIFTFDEGGHLLSRKSRGRELDVTLMEKILAEDAWVKLDGFVPGEYLEIAKKNSEKRTFPPPSMLPAK